MNDDNQAPQAPLKTARKGNPTAAPQAPQAARAVDTALVDARNALAVSTARIESPDTSADDREKLRKGLRVLKDDVTIAEASVKIADAEAIVIKLDEAFRAAVEADDDDEIAAVSAARKAAKVRRDSVLTSAGIDTMIPTFRAALTALTIAGTVPTGRFTLTVLFEGGKAIDVTRTAIEGSVPSAVRSAPVQAPVQTAARANFTVASAIDPRVPPVGYSSLKTTKGLTWRVTIVDLGVAEATCDGQNPVKGSLGAVGRAITSQNTCDPYVCFGLGSKGQSFDPARDTRWTKAA